MVHPDSEVNHASPRSSVLVNICRAPSAPVAAKFGFGRSAHRRGRPVASRRHGAVVQGLSGRTTHPARAPQPGLLRRANPRCPPAGGYRAPHSPRHQAGKPVTRPHQPASPGPTPPTASLPRHRAIVAVDIEQSTSRPDPVKAELRQALYELFDQALHAAGIHRQHRDRFNDRGDGGT
jgi:hypothetical protein